MRSILYIAAMNLALLHCSPKASKTTGLEGSRLPSKPSPQSLKSVQDVSSETAPLQQEEKKIEVTKLKITDLQIGKFMEGGTGRQEIVRFSTSGQTQYIQWKLCPQESSLNTKKCIPSEYEECGLGGACIQNVTPYSRILFPRLFAGKVLFSAKACVEPSNALDPEKSCGEYVDIEYDSHVTNAEVSALFAKRQSLLDYYKVLGEQKKELFQNYKMNLKECLSFDAEHAEHYEAKIWFIENVVEKVFTLDHLDTIGLGPAIDGAKWGLSKAVAKTKEDFCTLMDKPGDLDQECMRNLKDSNSPLTAKEQDAFCRSAKPNEGVLSSICSGIGTIANFAMTFAMALSPSESVPALSNAIMDTVDPEKSVSRQCQAEQKLANPLQQLEDNVAVLTQQFREVNEKLRALGEL